METLTHRGAEAVARAVPAGSLTHSLSNWPERELAATLHPHLFTMFAGAYGAMLVALWLLFANDINAVIALVVSTAYFAMYFGLPFVMLRLASRSGQQPKPGSLGNFLAGDVETYTGPVSGWGAVAQLMTIPVALTGAFIAIGIISRLV